MLHCLSRGSTNEHDLNSYLNLTPGAIGYLNLTPGAIGRDHRYPQFARKSQTRAIGER